MALLLLALLALAQGKYRKGSIRTSKDWVYVDKFCYDEASSQDDLSERGQLTFIFWLMEVDDRTIPNYFLFYYDDDNHWPEVYENSMSCQEKFNKSSFPQNSNGPLEITPGRSRTITFSGARPHFWYFAAASCDSEKMAMDYEISFTNPGNSWRTEFSFDESGSFELYTTFFVFFSILSAIHLHSVFTLYRAAALHPVVRLLTACIFLELASIFCIFIHFAVYAGDGVGSPGMDALGNILDMGSQLTFMLLLILLAKGWTITNNTVTDKKPLSMAMTAIGVMYLILFIWEYAAWDPATEVYIYESPPGIVLLVLRILIMFWFMFSARQTYLHESQPHKRTFYVRFGTLFSLWFFILPFIVIVAAAVDPWVRILTVATFYLLFTFISYATLVYLLWPTRAADYFKITPPDLIGGDAATITPYDTI